MNLFIFIMFLPTLAAICWGIWHEEKLVVFETWLFGKIRKLVWGGRRG